MPELPEIEVLRRSLEPRVVGSRIEKARVWNPDLRERLDPRRLSAATRRRRILSVRRRAKYLLLDLESDRTLAIHLGMSGRLTLAPVGTNREAHEHVTLFLDSGQRLRFRDTRRFGLVLPLRTSRLERDRHFAHLGIEPLAEDFSGETLQRLAKGRRTPIKTFLMDARLIVGVGNIYAAEALHRAGIHPTRSVRRIARDRWSRLAVAIQKTLRDAITQGGTTLNDFTDAAGESGYFRVSLQVYDRQGSACRKCGTVIRRIVQSGRSTFYCPGCQR